MSHRCQGPGIHGARLSGKRIQLGAAAVVLPRWAPLASVLPVRGPNASA